MSVVQAIIDAFGNQVAASEATGIAQQTISEWVKRDPPEIPPWRRPAILMAAQARSITLSAECSEYLCSNARTPKARAAA